MLEIESCCNFIPLRSIYHILCLGIWALVISLGPNSVKKNHGTFTGILLTGIVGGAIFPFLIALIAQIFELRYGMILIFFGLLYISYIGFYSKPINENNLIKL